MKVDPVAGKIDFREEKQHLCTMSKWPIWEDTNLVCVILGGAGGKTFDTRSISGLP